MLRFYTAGESHGQALLAFVSGLPAQLPIDVEFINREQFTRKAMVEHEIDIVEIDRDLAQHASTG